MAAEYGIEERIVRPAPELTAADVISTSAAAVLLKTKLPTLLQAIDRGRYTTVWQLGPVVTGRSARVLLRAEVEEAAAGGRRMSTAMRRQSPAAGNLGADGRGWLDSQSPGAGDVCAG